MAVKTKSALFILLIFNLKKKAKNRTSYWSKKIERGENHIM